MKNLIFIFTFFLGFTSFSQTTQKNVDTVKVNKEEFIINGVDFTTSRDGEKSLALAMDKLSDEELLEIIRVYFTTDGKLPRKKEH
jgi:hypothetical protein